MRNNKTFFLIICLCFTQISTAQNATKGSEKAITITGKITDSNQEPVEGALFYIDNLKTAYKSKSNGSYKIKVSPLAQKLTVGSQKTGFCDTIINDQRIIDFVLPNSVATVKTQASANRNKKNQSSKVNVIEGDRNQYASYSDIYQMLNGTVPGVVVNGKSIIIRGRSSMFENTQPIFVVDGVIVSSIDNVKPFEVKSIEVLKTSSAGMYGHLGSNGVIVITTIRIPENK
jgi:outer membrane receptor protein involved in Fe transport